MVRAAGAKTQFADAVALQDWLADGTFSYTLQRADACSTRPG